MTKVVNDLLTAVNCGKPSVILSLDISVAFDTLDYTRLLNRATEVFGLTNQVINWLKSYLTDPRKLPFYHCWLYYKSAARLCSWTSDLLDFSTPVGRLISAFNISYHEFADDTQLYTLVDFSSLADITIIMCRGNNQVASRELSVAPSVKNWGTEHRYLSNTLYSLVIVNCKHYT